MKFYKGTLNDAWRGKLLFWGVNRTEVKRLMKEAMVDLGYEKDDIKHVMASADIAEVKIETGVRHFVVWLNINFDVDNG